MKIKESGQTVQLGQSGQTMQSGQSGKSCQAGKSGQPCAVQKCCFKVTFQRHIHKWRPKVIVKSDAKSDVKKWHPKVMFKSDFQKCLGISANVWTHRKNQCIPYVDFFKNLLKYFKTQFPPAYLGFSITAFVHSALYIYLNKVAVFFLHFFNLEETIFFNVFYYTFATQKWANNKISQFHFSQDNVKDFFYNEIVWPFLVTLSLC